MTTKVIFYDTCSLLKIFNNMPTEKFYISSQTLVELEDIKTSGRKSEEIKFQARVVTRWLDKNPELYEIKIANLSHHKAIEDKNLEVSPDNLIIATAKSAYIFDNTIEFFSEDILCRLIAKEVFGLNVGSIGENNKKEYYKGYKDVTLTNLELADLYQNPNNNTYDCLINEYILVRDEYGNIVDTLKWDGLQYIAISTKNFKSRMFGVVKPMDNVQQMAFDSLLNNEITVLYGKAGSGKTTLPLSYIMQNLESHKFNKCYIVYHYETLKGTKTLGFVKGDTITKMLETASLGGILSSKFGDIQVIEGMIATGTLEIVPLCNIRGVEFGSEDVLFVTEAQNLSPYYLKTIIQRCKDGCKQIYEGDILEQSDINCDELGIDRMIDVFKGHKKFGVVKLKHNYRSEFCELADKM